MLIPRNITVVILAFLGTVFIALGLYTFTTQPNRGGAVDSADGTPVVSPRRLPDLMADAANDQALRKSLTDIINTSGINADGISISLEQDDRAVLSRDDGNSVIPASSHKLVTAATALDVIGKDTRFETKVLRDKAVNNGTLSGNLYLVGSGDPLLMTDDYAKALGPAAGARSSLNQLVDKIVAAGIKRINGNIVGDDSLFDKQRAIPTWSPSYATSGQVGPISALSVNQGFGAYQGGKVGASDPTQMGAQQLLVLLKAKGVVISGTAQAGVKPKSTSDVASIESPTITQIIDEMLTYSDNTTAEILLKGIAVKTGNAGTTGNGITAVRTFLKDQNIPSDAYAASDGSGLDRNDRSSCDLLQTVIRRPESAQILHDAMARAGETGTLKDRLDNTAAVGKVQAKTGTLSDVSALVGWATPETNSLYSFCTITNGVASETGRVLEDRLAAALAGFQKPVKTSTFAP